MGDTKPGPALSDAVQEVQGTFPNDQAMQDALSRLTLAGYDRAAFSLPEEQPVGTHTTPNEGADNPVDSIDKSQLRTMGTGMATFAGAAAAGAVTIATGGAAALAAAAALAVGAGTGALANATGNAVDQANVDERNRRGAAGTLVLAVRTHSAEQADEVVRLMREAGALSAESVTRVEQALTRGVSATSWTG